jgi:hypothetical protein
MRSRRLLARRGLRRGVPEGDDGTRLDGCAVRRSDEAPVGVYGLRGAKLANRVREEAGGNDADTLEPGPAGSLFRDAEHELASVATIRRRGGDHADKEDAVQTGHRGTH